MTTQTGFLSWPKLEPAIRLPPSWGTHSSGVVRGTPDLRPFTVSIRLGSPARSRIVTRPLLTFWTNLSVAVIWGSSLGIHGMAPMRTASGVMNVSFMGGV